MQFCVTFFFYNLVELKRVVDASLLVCKVWCDQVFEFQTNFVVGLFSVSGSTCFCAYTTAEDRVDYQSEN